MNIPRKTLAAYGLGAASIALALGGAAETVGADETAPTVTSVSFPLTTVVTGEPGTIHDIQSSGLGADMVGQSCSVAATADNNGSLHPQSDLIISSGTDQVTVSDVEATAGGVTTGAG